MQEKTNKRIHPLFQLLLMVALFLSLWLGFSQINWLGLIPDEEISEQTEQKLGELIEEFIRESEREIDQKEIRQKLDSLINRILNKNQLRFESKDIILIKSKEVNAFALPGNKVIIFSGLIESCSSEMELAGVIAHELAHLELGHVRKKLIKQIGMTVVSAAIGGQGGAELAAVIVEQLAGSAYDRSLEEEADLAALNYLIHAGLDPSGLAHFLKHMDDSSLSFDYLEWISTHPNTGTRIEYLEKEIGESSLQVVPVLGPEGWDQLKTLVKQY
jgi:predicted Zn-dependent protease